MRRRRCCSACAASRGSCAVTARRLCIRVHRLACTWRAGTASVHTARIACLRTCRLFWFARADSFQAVVKIPQTTSPAQEMFRLELQLIITGHLQRLAPICLHFFFEPSHSDVRPLAVRVSDKSHPTAISSTPRAPYLHINPSRLVALRVGCGVLCAGAEWWGAARPPGCTSAAGRPPSSRLRTRRFGLALPV